MAAKKIPIAFGRIDLVNPNLKRAGQPHKETANDVVFRNCAESLKCPSVLQRALKRLPSNLGKLDGWRVSALHPETDLGFVNPNVSEK